MKSYRIEPEEPTRETDPADAVVTRLEQIVQSGEKILFAQEFPRQTPRRNFWLVVTDGDEEKQEQR